MNSNTTLSACPTAPLSPAVMAAQCEAAVARAAVLAKRADAERRLSDLDADSLVHAVDLMAGRALIEAAR
ncbi:MAG TPA: hypothetical protein VJ816_00190 [Gemmatimonadales bacterium]|nr:hypothetical protein [Gemmatimonadales bacterium]